MQELHAEVSQHAAANRIESTFDMENLKRVNIEEENGYFISSKSAVFRKSVNHRRKARQGSLYFQSR